MAVRRVLAVALLAGVVGAGVALLSSDLRHAIGYSVLLATVFGVAAAADVVAQSRAARRRT